MKIVWTHPDKKTWTTYSVLKTKPGSTNYGIYSSDHWITKKGSEVSARNTTRYYKSFKKAEDAAKRFADKTFEMAFKKHLTNLIPANWEPV